MTRLEERIQSGLHETAERIPHSAVDRGPVSAKAKRPIGGWVAAATVLAVLALFSPLLILGGSREPTSPAETRTTTTPFDQDVVPAEVGFEFRNPEHVSLRFSQMLTLVCDGLEIVDNGGFESFKVDIWIDHQAGYARYTIEYPDGSTYDLILQGRPGDWERAWAKGTDVGRDAGCRETLADDTYDQSVAGWAYQDVSDLWFTPYLKPANPAEGEGLEVLVDGQMTRALAVGPMQYVIEEGVPGESEIRREFTLDEAQIRVLSEWRLTSVVGHFDAEATIEVLESGPTTLPPGIFDVSDFTPVWGGEPVPTTQGDS